MRDKVKRFISILMTALMLVNLMPVGALAEGFKISNSVQGIWEWWPEGSYKIYVYARVLKGSVGGIDVNKDGWYTLGYIDAQTMPSPSYGQKKYGGGKAQGYNGVGLDAESLIRSDAFHFVKNTNIPVRDTPIWVTGDDCGFKACDGATDYPETGSAPTWHLNILVSVKDVTPIHRLVFKVENSNGAQIGSKTIEGAWGQEITYEKGKDVPQTITTKDGKIYKLKEKNDNLNKTFKFDEVTKQIEFYYEHTGSVQHTLTINYVYEDGTSVEEDKLIPDKQNPYTRTLDHGTKYSVASPVIPGYTADNSVVEGTLTENTTVTVVYRKRNDLSYTVNYYWGNGSDKELITSTPSLYEYTLGDTVHVEPTKPDGYTPMPGSGETKTITIGADSTQNVINFYYYKNVELTANSDTKTYNGSEHSVSGFTGAPVDADFSAITVGASGTDAGTYPAKFAEGTVGTVDATKKYIVTEAKDGQLVINPIDEVVVKIAGNTKTETYNGKEHSVEGYTVTSISNPLYTANDFTFSGTAEAKGTDAGTYQMGLTADQFTNNKSKNFSKVTFEVADGWLKIDPVETEVVVKIAGNTKTETYNGKEHSVEGYTVTSISNPLYTANDFTFSGTAEVKGTDAGTYNMELKASDFKNISDNFSNVAFEIVDGTLTISPRKVKLTSASDEKVYDGKPLTNETVTVGGDGFADGEGATYKVTGSQTDVGESDNLFTFEVNEGTNPKNYSFEVAFGTLKVNPVTDEVIVTITGRTDETTYDGKPHFVFGFDAEPSNKLYNPNEDIQFNGFDEDMIAEGTDAGKYDMGLTVEHFTNKSKNFSKVTFVVTDGYVKINPRAVTLTSETAGKTYDGTALEKPVVTVGGDGFVEGQVKEIKATGSVTNAGSVANTITFTPDKETFKEGNYAITMNEGTLTIAKRSVRITSPSATKTYDGSALTRPAVTITGDGFVPGELAKAEATGSITNVGSTPNAIRYTTTGAFNAANYSIALSVGTLTVTEKPKPEPRRTFNLTINYVYQNGKRAAASYNRGGLKNGETFDITSPVIAGYTASETVVSGTIYNRDIKVTVIYTADGVNLDDYGVPLGLGNITMNVGDCFE